MGQILEISRSLEIKKIEEKIYDLKSDISVFVRYGLPDQIRFCRAEITSLKEKLKKLTEERQVL